MTPLAHRMVRQFIGEGREPIIPDRAGISAKLLEAHCFEISEIERAARVLSSDPGFVPDDLTASFLPAPCTWFEFRAGTNRFGYLLLERQDCKGFDMFICYAENNGRAPFDGFDGRNFEVVQLDRVKPETTQAWILVVLSMINTPKIVGRRQHMPHRGLERRLLRNRPNIGKFPLHAWTEIQLKISDPRDASEDGSVEAHYTGQRALHFCRSHLRIRMGRLELVKAHWRGDASLGVKRSRYKVSGQAPTTLAGVPA